MAFSPLAPNPRWLSLTIQRCDFRVIPGHSLAQRGGLRTAELAASLKHQLVVSGRKELKEYFTPWKLSSRPRWTVAVLALTGQDRYIQKAFQLFSNSSKTLSAPMLGSWEWEGSLSRELSLVSIYLHNYLALNGCVAGRRAEVTRGQWEPGRTRAPPGQHLRPLPAKSCAF